MGRDIYSTLVVQTASDSIPSARCTSHVLFGSCHRRETPKTENAAGYDTTPRRLTPHILRTLPPSSTDVVPTTAGCVQALSTICDHVDDIESVLRTELESGRGKHSSVDVKKDSRGVIDRKAMAGKLSLARGREVSPLGKYLDWCSARRRRWQRRRRVELRSVARICCV